MLNEEIYKDGMTLIFTTWNRLTPPDQTVSFIWFKLMADIPDEIFLKACLSISTKPGKAPGNVVAAIRDEAENLSGKMDWHEAYKTISDMFAAYYFPELGSCCWNIIVQKLKETGRPELIPFAKRWGREILFTNNPSTVRAQFRDTWKLEQQGEKLKRLGAPTSMKQLMTGLKLK